MKLKPKKLKLFENYSRIKQIKSPISVCIMIQLKCAPLPTRMLL